MKRLVPGTPQTVPWKHLLDVMADYTARRFEDEPLADLLKEGLDVFLELQGSFSASLFLLDRETFAFEHSVSQPETTVEETRNLFSLLVDRGLVARALEAGHATSMPSPDDVWETPPLMVIALMVPSGPLGLVLITFGRSASLPEPMLQRLCLLHARQLGYLFNQSDLLRRLKDQQKVLEQKVVARTQNLEEAERKLKTILDSIRTGVIMIDAGTCRIVDVNPAAAALIGATREQIVGLLSHQVICSAEEAGPPPEPAPSQNQQSECHLRKASGEIIPVLKTAASVTLGSRQYLLESYIDLTDRKRSEDRIRQNALRANVLAEISQALGEASLEYRGVLDTVARRVVELIGDLCIIRLQSPDGRWLEPAAVHHHIPEKTALLREALAIAPLSAEEGFDGLVMKTGQSLLLPDVTPEDLRTLIKPELLAALSERGLFLSSLLMVPLRAQGSVIGTLAIARHLPGRPYTAEDQGFLQDLANRTALAIANARLFDTVRQELGERKQLEAQLLQAQKMETIGRLTGGVAHELNNMLTPIVGYTQLVMIALSSNHAAYGDLLEIQKAADRAANLIRQLLAFSRRQTLKPQVISLNNILLETDKMLRRLIGEHIELVTLASPNLHSIRVDPGQLEQVLVNLAINARDAMAAGGKLTLETGNFTVDDGYARENPGMVPGEYVRLVVTDTGIGMNEEVKTHLFEPFFTTKEKGKGTGLGLATCYGIIKQSGGYIQVFSEPGQGTIFRIYFPKVEESVPLHDAQEEAVRLPEGTETLLLAEDEPSVRTMTARVLRKQGYTVIEASNGEEALRLVEKQGGRPLHLLVTDVVMPRMGGKELADHLRTLQEDIKVLFISGYTDDAITHHGVLEAATDFLRKPFSLNDITKKVREVLDRP